jgi:MoxR-like ATPase
MARTVRRPTTKTKTPTKEVTTMVDTKKQAPAIKRVAEVPDQKFKDGYVHRVIDGMTDFEALDAAMALKYNVILEGPTGCGKTSLVYAWCAAKGLPLYAFPSSSAAEPSQFRGRFVPDPVTGKLRWQDGGMTDVVRYGGVIYLNEGNFLRDSVASDMFGLLDKRRKIELLDNDGEVIYAPDEFMVIMDFNEGYKGTRELNAAFRNRFPIPITLDYDDKIEARLVQSKAIRDMAKQFRQEVAKGMFETPVATNMLIEFEAIALRTNVNFAIRSFIGHFPAPDRGAVKQIVDVWTANLTADMEKLKAPKVTTKKAATKDAVADDWDTDGVWDYDDKSSASAFQLFSTDDLAGLTLTQKRALAKDLAVPTTVTRKMKVDELTQLLLGNHPYWSE